MFQQLHIEVLGVVENMSFFVGDDGKEYDIFRRGGADDGPAPGVPFLGALPINMALRERSDSGDPTGNFEDKTRATRRRARPLEKLVTSVEARPCSPRSAPDR